MQRRDFFKFSGILGAMSVAPSVVLATSEINLWAKSRSFDVSLNHQLLEKGKVAKIWLPLILNTEYQHLTKDYAINTNAKDVFISDTQIPTLFAQFDEDEQKARLNVTFRVQTQERNTDFSRVNFNPNEKLEPYIAKFVKPSIHIQTDGIVRQKALEIVGGLKGDLEKAKAIYTWVANTMERDNSVIGCGLGDVKAILESGKLSGKCTDINSVFVGLCRAVGIPAREVFGIRVGQSRFSNEMGKAVDGVASISGGQHCRAEFYLKGYGWIPVDPADVAKVRLGEKLTNNDAKIVALREYLFGNWEMCWIGFNYARDFVLKPEPEQSPINNFGYPYAEVDGNTQNYYAPKEFSYSYSSTEIKA
ncbi:transglutaminase domain-containing protein [Campylobacter sp. faydin G-24]|uniref:Transglutaminase domain-containing protein n=1 Tax=Campylobacter anatolicus TaxID=2829105 RepID=A0ABS5HHU1_9BACT|nr:transglutaminase-like domain-containing protein [Campylobacter anatolicus]MBR8463841.1 transglutaminase domain-containing protein [Campylobacter anatolicus]